jgi:hypothetical protein
MGAVLLLLLLLLLFASQVAVPIGQQQPHMHCVPVRAAVYRRCAEHIKVVINCKKNATFLLHVGHLSTKSLLY